MQCNKKQARYAFGYLLAWCERPPDARRRRGLQSDSAAGWLGARLGGLHSERRNADDALNTSEAVRARHCGALVRSLIDRRIGGKECNRSMSYVGGRRRGEVSVGQNGIILLVVTNRGAAQPSVSKLIV
jgi:hypothetical protein